MSDILRQGRIVWAELLDPQERNPKVRPAVVLTSTSEIHPDGEIVIAAVTSQTDTVPSELAVELPWHRNGHPRTKLNRRNVVVCSWLVTIPVAEIRSLGGHVPLPELARILSIVMRPPDPSS